MSSTEILFNSPALHSLKRAQLLKLCKRHNIKASGKNPELVARLKEHAQTLTPDQMITGESDAASNTADESGTDDLDSDVFDKPQRPSEMWEIVMDDIPEEEFGSRPGSLKGKSSDSLAVGPDFGGTGGSSKSTVSSSIKALASTLGLKRSMAVSETGTLTSASSRKTVASANANASAPAQPRESLLANAIPYASLPRHPSLAPNTEPFAFSYSAQDTSLQYDGDADADMSISSLDRPIPGEGSRSGVEVAGLGAATGAGTIRLITSNLPTTTSSSSALYESPPRLPAVEPAFDLVPPTPGGLSTTRWPMTPGRPLSSAPLWNGLGRNDDRSIGKVKALYPSLENEKNEDDADVDMPGCLGTPQQQRISTPRVKSAATPHPPDVFVFGTPHAKSNADFNKAASSVLAEMNARLGLVGSQAIGTEILAARKEGSSKMTEAEILNYEFGSTSAATTKDVGRAAGGSITSKFDKVHEKAFAKMDGLDTHYSLRVLPQTQKDEDEEETHLEPLPVNRKRKSNVLVSKQSKLGHGRPSSAISNARRSSKARVISAGTRKKLGMGLPGAFGDDDEEDEENADEGRETKRARPTEAPEKQVTIVSTEDAAEKERKEREAIRRRLEIQKARRRSSKGRLSTGGPRASLANQKRMQKPAPSRFGFLSSAAKSLVKSVWNRGAGAPTPAPTALPVASSKPVVPQQASHSSKDKPPVPNAKKPTFAAQQKPTTSSAASRTSVIGGVRKVSGSSTYHLAPTAKAAKSGTLASVASARSNMSTTTTLREGGPRSRSPIPSFDDETMDEAKEKEASRFSIIENASAPPRRVRPSSTLLAPTASSLAKMNTKRPLPVPPVHTVVHPANASRQEVSPGNVSPSKIPVILPLSPRKKSLHPNTTPMSPTGGVERKSIFSTPLGAPSTPGVNPITGQPSPSRIPLANNTVHHNANTNAAAIRRGPSVQRKPRISRSKVIAKLGAQRAASSSTTSASQAAVAEGVSCFKVADDAQVHAPSGQEGGGLKPVIRTKSRPRSSIGASRRVRSSVGGVKASAGIGLRGSGVGLTAGAGAGGVLMSAKRRVRASEYARRRSEKVRRLSALQTKATSGGGEGSMDLDD